jgi:uncharacterized membrane protein
MSAYWADWLQLFVRWTHFTVGVAWIGASFYFNWLNNSVRAPEEESEGVIGEVWAIHGGAYYRVTKHDRNMPRLPKTLHWFKYEAYFTWITGFILLGLIYHMNAKAYLIKAGTDMSVGMATMISVGSLVVAWLVYDGLCRSPLKKHPVLFAALGFALMTLAAYGLHQVFSPRAAYIHVGAMIGTCMAANVFFVIIPGQRAMVTAIEKGEEPDVRYGQAGSFRSLHNNYLTLPVLFIMISSHFPMTFGHGQAWAVLAVLALISASVRHWFNLRGKGTNNVWILPVAALAGLSLAFVIQPTPRQAPAVAAAVQPAVDFAPVAEIFKQRCVSCHSAKPTHVTAPIAPKGVMFDTPAQIAARARQIRAQVVDSKIMPLGNLTQMTDAEREVVAAWLNAGAKVP